MLPWTTLREVGRFACLKVALGSGFDSVAVPSTRRAGEAFVSKRAGFRARVR
jgi:hypothetical protein